MLAHGALMVVGPIQGCAFSGCTVWLPTKPADDLCGDTGHHSSRWDVVVYEGSSGNESFLADLNPGQDSRARTDETTAAKDDRELLTRERGLQWMVLVTNVDVGYHRNALCEGYLPLERNRISHIKETIVPDEALLSHAEALEP